MGRRNRFQFVPLLKHLLPERARIEMSPTVAMALKEWAAVCEALAAGRQTILLRKGGIAEGPGGFRPEHAEFWLLPTYFHERPEALKPADQRFFESSASAPPADRVRIDLFARVAAVIHLEREESLERLADEHVYGLAVVRDRFHYRRPGLWLFAVQVFRAQSTMELPVWPELAGCHSWVELSRPLPTDGLSGVLPPAEFAERLARLRATLGLADEMSAAAAADPLAAAPAANPAASAARSPVDMAAILARFDGDIELVERLIAIYRQDRFPWMSRALGALVQQDTQALVFAAHRLHGLLSHFDGSSAAQTAGQFENFARQADFAAAQTAFGELETDLAVLDAALAGWRARG
jgi:HPt (histidine-containing phosphotransfer) domain-containing protein